MPYGGEDPAADQEKRRNPAKNQLTWGWGGGEAFGQSDLGTPNLDTAYALCVYDTTASVPTLAASVDVAPGPVWLTQAPKGWTYTNKEGTSDGVQLLKLKTGDAGTTKAQVKSAGVDLPIPTPLTGSVCFVRIRASSCSCSAARACA